MLLPFPSPGHLAEIPGRPHLNQLHFERVPEGTGQPKNRSRASKKHFLVRLSNLQPTRCTIPASAGYDYRRPDRCRSGNHPRASISIRGSRVAVTHHSIATRGTFERITSYEINNIPRDTTRDRETHRPA